MVAAVDLPDFREDIDAYIPWMQEAFTESQLSLPHPMKWSIAIRWHDGFSATEKHVALTLSTYLDKTKMFAYPSVATLACNCARKPDTVREALRVLSRWQWLAIKPFRTTKGNERATNRYTAHFPEDVEVVKFGHRTVALTQEVPW